MADEHNVYPGGFVHKHGLHKLASFLAPYYDFGSTENVLDTNNVCFIIECGDLNEALSVDGTQKRLVVVKFDADPFNNGFYYYNGAGVLTSFSVFTKQEIIVLKQIIQSFTLTT